MKHQPDYSAYANYFTTYTKLVEDAPLAEVLAQETGDSLAFWQAIRASETLKPYAEGKWTLREMLQHIIDTERIFQYRALAMARGEKASLPGFNHDEYVQQSEANKRAWSQIVAEWESLRHGTQLLFNSFSDQQLTKSGIANEKPFTVLACGYILAGHEKHHRQVTAHRYL